MTLTFQSYESFHQPSVMPIISNFFSISENFQFFWLATQTLTILLYRRNRILVFTFFLILVEFCFQHAEFVSTFSAYHTRITQCLSGCPSSFQLRRLVPPHHHYLGDILSSCSQKSFSIQDVAPLFHRTKIFMKLTVHLQ